MSRPAETLMLGVGMVGTGVVGTGVVGTGVVGTGVVGTGVVGTGVVGTGVVGTGSSAPAWSCAWDSAANCGPGWASAPGSTSAPRARMTGRCPARW